MVSLSNHDHFEGRSWRGLHHHTLLTMIAFAFLQHLRRGAEKNRRRPNRRPGHRPSPPYRRSAAGSSPPSPASAYAVRTAANEACIAARHEPGRVVLARQTMRELTARQAFSMRDARRGGAIAAAMMQWDAASGL